jgi:hypothetical protein
VTVLAQANTQDTPLIEALTVERRQLGIDAPQCRPIPFKGPTDVKRSKRNVDLHGHYPTTWGACALIPMHQGKGNPIAARTTLEVLQLVQLYVNLFSVVITLRLHDWEKQQKGHGPRRLS